MARYRGPREKIARRFGVALFGPSKALETRNFPPGQHGARAGRHLQGMEAPEIPRAHHANPQPRPAHAEHLMAHR